MPPRCMDIKEVGDVYELKRGQWKGHTARISNDPALLEKVKKYTWTYCEGDHPYLRNSVLKVSLHEFVMFHIYGEETIKQLQAAGNIIEHLDNNGLNCTYENLHILSADMNKTKAFSVDKMGKKLNEMLDVPAFIIDVYYLHAEKRFQMQLFMNEDLYFNKETHRAAEMFICLYGKFERLYTDWFYLLSCVEERSFDVTKLVADSIGVSERPYIHVSPEEKNSQFIIKDGVVCLNLDAKNDNGASATSIRHTARRKICEANKENG